MSGVRPFVLVILDGWGCNPDPYGNAIAAAHTPEIDALETRWPHTQVDASGETVGLPAGQQGNSEVGHLTIGAGRLIYQPLSRINHAIEDGSFYENPVLCDAVDRARDRGGGGAVASVSGRYYAMDRDRRWDRTQQAYEVIAGAGDGTATDAVAYIEAQYAAGVSDEFVAPVSILHEGRRVRIEDGDSIVFFNFRPDRARQLCHALVDPDFEGFSRSRRLRDVDLVTFTEYERELNARVAFPREDIRHTLAEEVSAAGLRQFHVAETEKYAHVTYFINGGREPAFDGEERVLVPSPRGATYDTVPEMNAAGVPR